MSPERITELEAYSDKMALLQNKSFEERKMAKVIKELLGAVKSKAVNNEAEYKRGYDAGVHDERDRAYEAKKKQIKTLQSAGMAIVEADYKLNHAGSPEQEPEEQPFGVEDL